MMGSTLVAFLGALHYWWPKFTGRMYNETLGRVCATGVFFGFNLTFLPQFVMGARGMPRRYWDYDPQYQIYPPALDDRRVRPRHLDVRHRGLPVRVVLDRQAARRATRGARPRSSGRRRPRRRSTTSRSRRSSTSSTTTTISSRSRRIAGSAARRASVELASAAQPSRRRGVPTIPAAVQPTEGPARRPPRIRTMRRLPMTAPAARIHGSDAHDPHGATTTATVMARRSSSTTTTTPSTSSTPASSGSGCSSPRRCCSSRRCSSRTSCTAYHHPEIYSYAHKYLDVKYGAINTAVLIFSSLTAAWAVRCAQLNQRRGLILCIAVTIACACAFLGIKYIEYAHKVSRAHPVRPLLRSVRQLGWPRAPDPEQQLRRHEVDRGVGLGTGTATAGCFARPTSIRIASRPACRPSARSTRSTSSSTRRRRSKRRPTTTARRSRSRTSSATTARTT